MEAYQKYLSKFWIEVEWNFISGVGVTAFDEADAQRIIVNKISSEVKFVSITKIHSLDELDQGHVLPNMEEWVSRGIWHPKGY